MVESNPAVEAAVQNWAKEMEKTKAAKTTESDQSNQSNHICSRCERSFDTKQGLATHTRACKLKVNSIESVNSTFSELNNTITELNASHLQTSPSEHPLDTSTLILDASHPLPPASIHNNQYLKGLESRLPVLENIVKQQQLTIEQLLQAKSPPPPNPSPAQNANEAFYQETIRSLIAKLGTAPSPHQSFPAPAHQLIPAPAHQSIPVPPRQSISAPPQQIAKTTRIDPPKNPQAATGSPKKSSASAPAEKTRKRAEIIGDSTIGGLWNWGKPNYHVKVNKYGGGTSADMVDLAEMSLRREPDALIVHSGTNDFDAKINTKNQLQRVIAKARGKNADIKIGISAICLRVDRPEMKTKVKDMNNQLKNFCHQHQVTFIDHDDFDRSCLAAKGLHPNSNGNTSLYMDFNRTVSTMFN